MTKLGMSPVTAESALAASRIKISGLRNRARNWTSKGWRSSSAASFGPYCNSRAAAVAPLSPVAEVSSRANNSAPGNAQRSSAPMLIRTGR